MSRSKMSILAWTLFLGLLVAAFPAIAQTQSGDKMAPTDTTEKKTKKSKRTKDKAASDSGASASSTADTTEKSAKKSHTSKKESADAAAATGDTQTASTGKKSRKSKKSEAAETSAGATPAAGADTTQPIRGCKERQPPPKSATFGSIRIRAVSGPAPDDQTGHQPFRHRSRSREESQPPETSF